MNRNSRTPLYLEIGDLLKKRHTLLRTLPQSLVGSRCSSFQPCNVPRRIKGLPFGRFLASENPPLSKIIHRLSRYSRLTLPSFGWNQSAHSHPIPVNHSRRQPNRFDSIPLAFILRWKHAFKIILQWRKFRSYLAFDAPDFLKPFIISFFFRDHSRPPSCNICGVHMQGHTYPASRHIRCTKGMVCPFVICLKFQETR